MTHSALQRVADQQGVTVEQLVSRLRQIEKEYASDMSRCDYCEEPLPVTRRRDARFCPGTNCRKYNSRDRKV
jgi:HEPN domain-containing protein